MFGILYKNISFVIRTSPIHAQNPSILSSLRYLSSTSNKNASQQSFTVSYLINKCGFSLESALSASKLVHFEIPHKPDSVLSFFKNHGFSESQILILTRRLPQLLICTPNKTLLPKLQFLHSKGVSSRDVAKIISYHPWILKNSVENQWVPIFNFFKSLFHSNDTTITAIKRYPGALKFQLQIVTSILNILSDYGVPEKNIVMLVRFKPSIIGSTPQKFKKLVEEVRAMGFDPSKTQFFLAMMVVTSMSKSVIPNPTSRNNRNKIMCKNQLS